MNEGPDGPRNSFSLGEEGGVMNVPGGGGQSGEGGGLLAQGDLGEPGSVPPGELGPPVLL